ncbi:MULTISPECIES: organoarsenical effux MFS transporter ArsJ [unclassified Halomonas]|uniref:organoarsenical effux MFS transporter ArsJ n=1 Tax=unclassified Halomonas TaxID=2609666 RepID=UPI0028867BBE|nr:MULTISPECIES: organoarsenical effux MFS transporter ArsJ [unclassified Halomonas]MDT0502116.1 organoarsenical effux MFS transporter ArsJ [Halomonas sp. PAR7]MDT0510875.1 organoarsenical effux MFS transporter ArsJ [Halomonas sp. LES1]MDT0593114.1 organoarsenical effux MFS transporter ArsJ [Halomonas sp. PAR8]
MADSLASRVKALPFEVRQYLLITGNYWAFTLTDGALRMLVVLHFHQLGYSPLEVALLFLFYEAFGVVTNLVGGWLGARLGLNRTMNLGLGLQILALAMLMVPATALSVPWVMTAQALSGVAKDLNKMSAKSAVRVLVPGESVGAGSALYRWVAILTGSKNALKGAGFFLGGALLTLIGFRAAVLVMALMLCGVLMLSLWRLTADLGRQARKPKFREVFSSSRAVNVLSAARLCLFASRDVWFVVALPVFLFEQHGWSHWTVGGLLAIWVIGYGGVQTQAPRLTGLVKGGARGVTVFWALALAGLPALLALLPLAEVGALVTGLLAFGVLFAVNSSWHSYLIVHYARADGVSMDVGFYYMANAMGRLAGTLLSGWVYQAHGLAACLWISATLVVASALMALALPREARAVA